MPFRVPLPIFRRRVRFVRRRRFPTPYRPRFMPGRRFTRAKPEINYKEFFLETSYGSAPVTTFPAQPAVWNTAEDVTAGITATPANIARIVVGASQNERIGRKILIKSIQLKTELVGIPQGAEPASPYTAHIALVRFRNQQGRAPNSTNIWKHVIGPPFVSYAPIRDQDHIRDYEIVFHKKYTVKTDWEFVPSDDSVAGQYRKVIEIYKKFKKPLMVNYYANNTTPTSASIEQGGLYFYVWTDQDNFAATATNNALCLVKFLDM